MAIYAISDLHLSFSNKDKPMSVFGDKWEGYEEKIKKDWLEKIKPEDVWNFILALRDSTKINKIKDECGDIQTEHLFDKLLYGNYIKLHRIDKVAEALEETFGIDKKNISRDKLLTMSVSCLSNLYSKVLTEKTKGKKHETGSSRKK